MWFRNELSSLAEVSLYWRLKLPREHVTSAVTASHPVVVQYTIAYRTQLNTVHRGWRNKGWPLNFKYSKFALGVSIVIMIMMLMIILKLMTMIYATERHEQVYQHMESNPRLLPQSRNKQIGNYERRSEANVSVGTGRSSCDWASRWQAECGENSASRRRG